MAAVVTIFIDGKAHTLRVSDKNVIYIDNVSSYIESIKDGVMLISDGKELFQIRFDDLYRTVFGNIEPTPIIAGRMMAQYLQEEQSSRVHLGLKGKEIALPVGIECSRRRCHAAANRGILVPSVGGAYVVYPYCDRHVIRSNGEEDLYPVGVEG